MENYCRQKDGYKESFSKNMVVPRAKSKGWNSERRKNGILIAALKSTRWQQVRLLQHIVLVYIEQEV